MWLLRKASGRTLDSSLPPWRTSNMTTSGSIAVVFGVGGGIGGAVARALAAQGRYGHVVGVARRRPPAWSDSPGLSFVAADILDEGDLKRAAESVSAIGRVTRTVVATGLLHAPGLAPEKTMRSLDAENLLRVFAVNAAAPALIAKHFLPLTPRDQPSVFAALSARVGSISDNRLGGWHSYRASKAALNMLIATLAIEHKRTHPLSVCVTVHPGTVDTALSAPFQSGSAGAPRVSPEISAPALVDMLDTLAPDQSGGFFGWDGKPIAW